jgi:hypothetical protein
MLQQRGITRIDEIAPRPETRPIPIAPVVVPTGTAVGVFTSPATTGSVVSGLVVSNESMTAIELTLHIGTTATSGNRAAVFNVSGNSFVDLSGLLMVPPESTLWAAASLTGLKVSGWATGYM